MNREMHKDLRDRLEEAHAGRTCVIAQSESDAHRLRNACRRGDVVSPAPGVYALPALWNELKPLDREVYRVRALAKLHPTWVFAGFSAAAIHGLEVTYSLLGPFTWHAPGVPTPEAQARSSGML